MGRYYYKHESGYITAIGTGSDGEEIPKDKYDEIHFLIQQKPAWENGMDYRLTVNLSWEPYERPLPEEADETVDTMTETEQKARAFDILTGVSE